MPLGLIGLASTLYNNFLPYLWVCIIPDPYVFAHVNVPFSLASRGAKFQDATYATVYRNVSTVLENLFELSLNANQHSKSSLLRPAFLARLSPDGSSSFHSSGGVVRWLPPRVRKSLLSRTELAQRPRTQTQCSRGCRCSRVRPPVTPVRFWGGTAGTRSAVTWVYPDARK